MKTINKKKLAKAIKLRRMDMFADNDSIWNEMYSLCTEITKESEMMGVTTVYVIITGILYANKNVTNTQIYNIFEILGYEVK